MADAARPVLLYAGDCRLCRFAARAVVRLDRSRELLLLPFDALEAGPLLEDVPDDVNGTTWLLVAGRTTYGYGRGGVELARAMRLTRPAARPLDAIPPGALDGLYRLVAQHRSRLGRLVPDGPAPRRYP